MTVAMVVNDSVDSLPPVHAVSLYEFNEVSSVHTFQNGSVCRFDSQRGNVGNNLRTSFEDDQEHTNRTRLALQNKTIIQLCTHIDLSNYKQNQQLLSINVFHYQHTRIVQSLHIQYTLQHILKLARSRKIQSFQNTLTQLAISSRLCRNL